MSSTATNAKALRADAQRNYDTVLAAARVIFARFGVDAPLEEVTREAGVGRGTLYRHFPTRDHLLVAILQDRVDLLEQTARAGLDAPDAWRALSDWLALFDQSAAQYGGMSAWLSTRLMADGTPVAALCGPMKDSFRRLFDRASEAADLRRDVDASVLLAIVSALPKDARTGATVQPCLDIVLRGLRR